VNGDPRADAWVLEGEAASDAGRQQYAQNALHHHEEVCLLVSYFFCSTKKIPSRPGEATENQFTFASGG